MSMKPSRRALPGLLILSLLASCQSYPGRDAQVRAASERVLQDSLPASRMTPPPAASI